MTLHASNLKKKYGTHLIFENVSFDLNAGQKLALVGRNGCGKSSLMKILSGLDQPDDGKVSLSKGTKLAYLDQHRDFKEPTVLEEVVAVLSEDYYGLSFRAEQILEGLGLGANLWDLSPKNLSGGQRLRLALAVLLASEPSVLLLDEPTNHLDLGSSLWLSRFLRTYPSAAIIISHDRDFLDYVCDSTAGIFQKKLFFVRGKTTEYFNLLMQNQKTSLALKQKMDKEKAHQMAFIERFRAKASKAAQVKSREKRLDKMPKVEEWLMSQDLEIQLNSAHRPIENIIEAKDIEFTYVKDSPLIGPLSLEWGGESRLAVVGGNGKGKTTLLKLLIGELQPINGTIKIHNRASLGYFGQRTIEQLDGSLSALQVLQQSSKQPEAKVRRCLGSFGIETDMQQRPLNSLSGGERARVVLAQISLCETHGLILDEPTHHLDLETVESLMHAISQYEGAVILVTHSIATLEAFESDQLLSFEANTQIWQPEGYERWYEKQLQALDQKPAPQTSSAKKNSHSNTQKKALATLNKQLANQQKKIDACEGVIQTLYEKLASPHLQVEQSRSLQAELKQLQKELTLETQKGYELLEQQSSLETTH